MSTVSLEGRTIRNHQKYEISFGRDRDGRLVCDLNRDCCQQKRVPVFTQPDFVLTASKLANPYALTFYPSSHALVVGDYGLRGGMFRARPSETQVKDLACVLKQSDIEIAETLRERLPPKICTHLNVRAIDYNFSGQGEPIEAYLISLNNSRWARIRQSVKALFKGFIELDPQHYSAINPEELHKELVGYLSNKPSTCQEIAKESAQGARVELYVDACLKEGIVLKVHNGGLLRTIYRISNMTSEVIRMALPWLIMMRLFSSDQGASSKTADKS